MKHIISILLILVSIKSFAQTDSSRALITVSVQARDLAYMATFTGSDPIWEDLDSVMKTKFRVTSPPTGTTAVSIAGVPVRAWWWALLRMTYDPIAANANINSRLATVLNGAGNTWLTYRISRETNNVLNQFQNNIQLGTLRLTKQYDTQTIQ